MVSMAVPIILTSRLKTFYATRALFLLCQAVLVTGAALSYPRSSGLTEFSLDHPDSVNASSLAMDQSYCTGSWSWMRPICTPGQCTETLSKMYIEKVQRLGKIDFEFIAPGVTPVHGPLMPQTTPKRWNIGVFTIVLSSSFPTADGILM